MLICSFCFANSFFLKQELSKASEKIRKQREVMKEQKKNKRKIEYYAPEEKTEEDDWEQEQPQRKKQKFEIKTRSK